MPYARRAAHTTKIAARAMRMLILMSAFYLGAASAAEIKVMSAGAVKAAFDDATAQRLKDTGKYNAMMPKYVVGLASILVEQGRYTEAEQLARVAGHACGDAIGSRDDSARSGTRSRRFHFRSRSAHAGHTDLWQGTCTRACNFALALSGRACLRWRRRVRAVTPASIEHFVREDDGQDVVEYGLLIATVAIMILLC